MLKEGPETKSMQCHLSISAQSIFHPLYLDESVFHLLNKFSRQGLHLVPSLHSIEVWGATFNKVEMVNMLPSIALM